MGDLPAGRLSAWLEETRRSQVDDTAVDVPCGDCSACCRSAYFIHVEPDETETLRRIPRELRFPAPGLPKGHVVLGYDQHGRCAMLVDDRCSIYDHRPRTCRSYDCRVFAATGVSPDEDGKPLIAERVRRWRFDVPEPLDRAQRDGLVAAVAYLRAHPELFPGGDGAANATQLAGAAVRVRPELAASEPPDADRVRFALRREPTA